MGPGNHILGGGADLPGARGTFLAGTPLRCGFSSDYFDPCVVVVSGRRTR